MPFGLSIAPPTFQGLMNELIQQSLYQTNLIFLDDVLTYSKTAEDHLKHLEEVFIYFEESLTESESGEILEIGTIFSKDDCLFIS